MRITALDGEPIDAVLDALETYSGGMDHWRLFTSLLLLESPELLHAAGIAESADGYTLTVAGPDGEEQDVALDAYATDLDQDSPSFSKPWRNLDAQPLPDEGADWTYTLADLAASDVPLYLQDSDTYYVWAALEDGGGYMRFDESSNSRTQRMAEFFEQNVAALPDGSLEYVVVDLRPNWGGNSNLFVEPAQWLPDKVAEGGHVYVVVGPHTFSAGYNAAALFDYYGGEQSVLVGAPMGIRPQYWGDYGMDFNLPNTGWQLAYATAYHDWENGCDEHPYCHPQTVIHGVAAGDLTPDPIIEPTYADYAAGRDVVMEWISEQETP
jgi:hypothetical protein